MQAEYNEMHNVDADAIPENPHRTILLLRKLVSRLKGLSSHLGVSDHVTLQLIRYRNVSRWGTSLSILYVDMPSVVRFQCKEN